MWSTHWHLSKDPFAPDPRAFVPLRPHLATVARLVHLVDSREPVIPFRHDRGLGRSTILAEALRRLASPRVRVARVADPIDGESVVLGLLESLGCPTHRLHGRDAIRSLADRLRTIRQLGQALVLAIDGDEQVRDDGWPGLLSRLDPHPDRRVSVLSVGTPSDDPDDDAPWLSLPLDPLSAGDGEILLRERLRIAGLDRFPFSTRAVEVLHHLSAGHPAPLVRLARFALLDADARRLDAIGSDVVEIAADRCPRLPGVPARLR